MRTLHGIGVVLVKGAFVLIDHDAVLVQSFEAVAVELLRKKPLARPERIGRIHEDQIILVLRLANEAQSIFEEEANARICKARRRLRQVLAARLDDHLVDLHEVDALDAFVAQKLAHRAAVAAADDEDALRLGIDAHRHMHDHLMVDELVLLRQHHVAVDCQKAPKLRRFEDIDALKVAPARVNLPIDLDGKARILRVLLRKPKIHASVSFITLSRRISISSGPVSEQPFFFA